MTADETIKILATLKAAYPHSFKDLTKRDAEAMIELWAVMFAEESYAEVNAAIGALIATRTVGFSPTIGEVKAQLQKFRSANLLSEQEAWALVSKATRTGSGGFKKEFAALPREVQRAVGSPEQLRAWASMEADTVESVVASNFMRSYRSNIERAKEMSMLPPEIRQVIGGIADGMKMIGGGE